MVTPCADGKIRAPLTSHCPLTYKEDLFPEYDVIITVTRAKLGGHMRLAPLALDNIPGFQGS